jgi:hypothetical protein
MKAAYADPPYLGVAEKFYGELHPEAAEYDKLETHARLVERLMDEYDTWAMSLHVPSLREILGVCPDSVRVAAWVKPCMPAGNYAQGNAGALRTLDGRKLRASKKA